MHDGEVGPRLFDDILKRAIEEGIEKIVGERVGRTIEFHSNPTMALVDAGAFAGRIEKLFGPASDIILRSILGRLSDLSGHQAPEGLSFEESVREVESNFSQTRKIGQPSQTVSTVLFEKVTL